MFLLEALKVSQTRDEIKINCLSARIHLSTFWKDPKNRKSQNACSEDGTTASERRIWDRLSISSRDAVRYFKACLYIIRVYVCSKNRRPANQKCNFSSDFNYLCLVVDV